jgi:hypothetical protein
LHVSTAALCCRPSVSKVVFHYYINQNMLPIVRVELTCISTSSAGSPIIQYKMESLTKEGDVVLISCDLSDDASKTKNSRILIHIVKTCKSHVLRPHSRHMHNGLCSSICSISTFRSGYATLIGWVLHLRWSFAAAIRHLHLWVRAHYPFWPL